MKHQPKKYTHNIPEEALINDVKAVAKKLGSNTVTMQNHLDHGTYNPSTIRYRFRGWLNALERAGLEPSRTRPNVADELLFKNLEEVGMRLGKLPSSKDLDRRKAISQTRYSATTYVNHFGSWSNALRKFIEYQNFKSSVKDKMKNKTMEGNLRQVPFKLRFNVLIRDGLRCTLCGRSPLNIPGVELHCDHIIPYSKGGKTVTDNLRTLCSLCNLGKGSKLEIRE